MFRPAAALFLLGLTLSNLCSGQEWGLNLISDDPKNNIDEEKHLKVVQFKDNKPEDDAVEISEYFRYNDVIKEGDILVRAPAERLIHKLKDGDDCVCMNWRVCKGKIIDGHPCPQSYIDVCCQTEQNFEEDKNEEQLTFRKLLLSKQ
ncbi:uncharacterized protein LOC113386395 [Ctenocephalides felis]|uniref:uncharacterized protein LOC113386395 n=1 Tax=Ctenocephalides felis TaxID=7515 RepID=UPI000E6E2EC7|nr:uncharacterized protein LOC113386395 [Ctenocephalides felis]